MAGTSSWSSSSSCTSSLGSFDDDVVCVVKPDASAAAEGSVKLLCSYGGRILPRHCDEALRYVGGDNRVISVDRSLYFYELQRKLRDMCGWEEVTLRCQLPTEDLDRTRSSPLRATRTLPTCGRSTTRPVGTGFSRSRSGRFLFPRATPPVSPSTPSSTVSRPIPYVHHQHHMTRHARHQVSPPAGVPQQQNYHRRATGGESRPHRYLIHNGSQWQ